MKHINTFVFLISLIQANLWGHTAYEFSSVFATGRIEPIIAQLNKTYTSSNPSGSLTLAGGGSNINHTFLNNARSVSSNGQGGENLCNTSGVGSSNSNENGVSIVARCKESLQSIGEPVQLMKDAKCKALVFQTSITNQHGAYILINLTEKL
jgi:hypothetical protein